MGLQIAQMWDAADGKLVDMSSDTLPGLPTQEQILEMRAKGVAADAAGRLRLSARTGRRDDRERAGRHDRALQSHAHVPRASALRDAVVRHAPRRDAAAGTRRRAGGRRRPATANQALRAADVAVVREDRLRARSVRRRHLRRHLDFDPAVAGRRPGQHARARSSITGRSASRTSTPTVARLKSEGVKFLEEIHPWGNTRAAMIEGPDRIAIELVEVKQP